MSGKIKDGGPAFPVAEDHSVADHLPWTAGMTLRDWFAGQALVGIINACAMDTRERGETTEKMFTRKAYSIADAMLAARESGE